MGLKLKYDKKEEIPSGKEDLYTEKEGAWHLQLSEIEGVKTDEDVAKVQKALDSERDARKKAEANLKPWETFGDKKPDEIQADLDRIPELEAASQGKLDKDKLEELAEKKAEAKVAPVQRKLDEANEELGKVTKDRDYHKGQLESKLLGDAVRAEAIKMEVVQSAIPDIEIIAKDFFEKDASGNYVVKADAVGATPGLSIADWMKDQQKVRPHMWAKSEGGGASGANGDGAGGVNPWKKEHWNQTTQMEIYNKDPAEAERLATAAKVTIGATGPYIEPVSVPQPGAITN